MADLHALSLGQIVAGIKTRLFSPLEVAQACIRRHAQVEKYCLAWEHFDPEALQHQAQRITERLVAGAPSRPFEAAPIGIKDIFNTIDFPTQMGSPLWKGFTPGNDARIVFSARQLGALFPGKTTTAEFAVHTLGKTLNPFAPDRTPGTSSSGSAAAVSARMVPVALGTQTAGSITRPASFCGVYGYKPSFGLLPRTGMLKTTDSLDTIGFFAAHSADMRRVLDGLRVRGRDYPIVNTRVDAAQARPHGKPWRIALFRTHTWGNAEPYARDALDHWLGLLTAQPGIEVTEIPEPPLMETAHETHAIIYDKSLAYYFKEEFKRKELISPVMYGLIDHGNSIAQGDYLGALARQAEIAEEMDTLLQNFDAFVSLATAGAAPARHEREKPDPSLMWTMAYLPTIAIPCFQTQDKLPFSLQLGARRYNDYLLLDLVDTLVACGLAPAVSSEPEQLSTQVPASASPDALRKSDDNR